MFKVNNKDTRTTSIVSFWCLFVVSVVNFEHVTAGYVALKLRQGPPR